MLFRRGSFVQNSRAATARLPVSAAAFAAASGSASIQTAQSIARRIKRQHEGATPDLDPARNGAFKRAPPANLM